MFMEIQHGILEVVNYPGSRASAIVFNNDIILTTASILEPYFLRDNKSEILFSENEIKLFLYQLNGLHRSKDTNKCGIISFKEKHDSNFNEFLRKLEFTITYDRKNIVDKTKHLRKYGASLAYIFNSKEIYDSLGKIFDHIQMTPTERHSITTSGDCSDRNYTEHVLEWDMKKTFLSTFLVLQRSSGENIKSHALEYFIKYMRLYIKLLDQVNKLDDVLTISTPLSLENFYKTINIGRISNVTGENECLFLVSNPLTVGCEGSAVFNSKLKLIGIIILTTMFNSNTKERIDLTMASRFENVFREFLRLLGRKDNVGCPLLWSYPSDNSWENSLILITSSFGFGTGTFVKILNRNFILTCTHVVREVETLSCRYVNGDFQTDVIWKNPTDDEPFDVALLNAPEFIPDHFCRNISSQAPKLGQNVFNAGFPYFILPNDQDSQSSFSPSIFEGKVIKYSQGLIITDANVQAGQSGSPLWDENGNILGICVSNLKVNNDVYPSINFAVPIIEIKSILESFVKSDDLTVLSKLIASANIKRAWDLKTPLIESKL